MLPATCRGCPVFEWDKNFVETEGTGSSGLLVVAEAPGEWEAEEKRPLSPNGRSGKVFRRALRELGIPAHTLCITNVLRSRPPNNELLGMWYEAGSIGHCSQYLRRTIDEVKPRAIIALGGIPTRELQADDHGTHTVVRGFLRASKYGVPLISTYHPSFIARGAWQLYGTFKSDIKYALEIAQQGVPVQGVTQYELNPSIERVRHYLRYLSGSGNRLPISYDVETDHIIGNPEPDDWRLKRIVQIQFSHRAGYAIVLPYTGEYRLLAHAILALSNPKWGWNSRLSDDLALESDGAIINGERHDLMNAWGHLQPSFWGGKEDQDTDKGVPSRLMGLQSAASFYCREVGPWKHLASLERIKADPELLKLYGAYDADYNARVGIGIMASLEKTGLMAGYRSHKLGMRPVLDDLGTVGLPVDAAKQQELRTYVTGELQSIQQRIQSQVPPAVLGLHPKTGYKALHNKLSLVEEGKDPASWLKTPLRAIIEGYDPANPPLVMAAGHVGYLVQREFKEDSNGRIARISSRNGAEEHQLPHPVVGPDEIVPVDNPVDGYRVRSQDAAGGTEAGSGRTARWCIERLFNPHGSSPNTKSYIRVMGYPMPTAIDSGLDTTGKLQLQQLAERTGDEVLSMVGQWREMHKTGMDYTSAKWTPGTDGRVHATFRFGTASAQTTAINPPVQTFPEHSGIAQRAKEAIRAEPGHMLVDVDMRGFHARMAGWLSRDPAYYRLANFDVHSFVTAHFLRMPDADYQLEMDDDELTAYLEHVKSDKTRKDIRNYKVKRVVHGVTFGMRARKLYMMYAQNFENEREAQQLIDLLASLFPRVFIAFPTWIEDQIRNVTPCRLVSPFGHHRLFYDYDMQQATAFYPSNNSHCHIQAALVRLRTDGALARYEAVNFKHDSLSTHPRIELVDECIATVQAELERPSDVLVNWMGSPNPLGPFTCNSDAKVGLHLAAMKEYKL